MDEDGAIREQALHRGLQVRHLQREPNRSAEALARFDLVNRMGLFFVEYLERGLAHIEDDGPPLIARPDLRGFKPEAGAIESHEAFIVAGGQRDPQFQDRAIRS